MGHAWPVWAQASGASIPGQALVTLPGRPGTRSVSTEWLVAAAGSTIEERLDPAWLPDNRTLVFSTVAAARPVPHIERLDTRSGHRVTLGEGSHPQPSPDGQWIAYTRALGDTVQLWVMTNDGRQARRIFARLARADEYYDRTFAWAPDSHRIAVGQQPFQPTEAALRPITQRDTTRSSAVEGSALRTKPPHGKLWIIDAASGRAELVLQAPGRFHHVQWFPDGSAVMLANDRYAIEYGLPRDQYEVQALRLRDRRVWTIAAPAGLQQSLAPALSPDGTRVVVGYDADHPWFDFQVNLGLAATAISSASAPPIARLTHNMQLHYASWAPEGDMLYARRQYGAYAQIYAIDPFSGAPTQLTRGPWSVEEYTVSPDGGQVAWSGRDFHGRVVLRVGRLRGKVLSEARELFSSDQAATGMALSEVREIEWHTPGYPNAIRGLIIYPLHYQENRRYPLFIDMHGGGLGAWIYNAGGLLLKTPLEWQMWAAKNYAVFVPDYRSSVQYGSLAVDQIREQQSELSGDMADVLAGVNTLIASGLVDSTRMVAFGHSQGGRRANWLAVTTHRFRAIVSKEGWADDYLRAGVFPSELTHWLYNGTPVTAPEHYIKESAIYHTRGATTPTLFLMGSPEHGGADLHQSVLWLHHALKEQGVETRYVLYPDEGHVFEREANQRDVLARVVTWVDAYLR